jgi:hypothetical protein
LYKSRSKSTASSNIDESASHTANGNTASPPVAKLPPQHKSTKRQNTLTLDKYHLVIENTGVCPDHCSAVVNISDDTNHTVYSFNASKTYIMQPLIIHFNNAANGFLLKYWEWQPDKVKDFSFVCGCSFVLGTAGFLLSRLSSLDFGVSP